MTWGQYKVWAEAHKDPCEALFQMVYEERKKMRIFRTIISCLGFNTFKNKALHNKLNELYKKTTDLEKKLKHSISIGPEIPYGDILPEAWFSLWPNGDWTMHCQEINGTFRHDGQDEVRRFFVIGSLPDIVD